MLLKLHFGNDYLVHLKLIYFNCYRNLLRNLSYHLLTDALISFQHPHLLFPVIKYKINRFNWSFIDSYLWKTQLRTITLIHHGADQIQSDTIPFNIPYRLHACCP